MATRVVVTGLGAVSPVGNNIKDFWNSLINGFSGVTTIPQDIFDTREHDVKIAALVKDFNPEDYGIGAKETKRMDSYAQFGVAAASQALKDAGFGLEKLVEQDNHYFGCIISSGMGGLITLEEEY